MDELPLSDAEFDGIRERIYRLAGIALSDAKRTMVVGRLQRLMRQLKITSFTAYLDALDAPGPHRHVEDFVNALTTNLTRFWREEHHFDHLVTYVAHLIAQRPRRAADGRPRLRIWSAGCSTGQEAYSIALDLLAVFPELKRWDFRILATDIDTAALAKAERGIYPDSELSGVTPGRAALLERLPDGSLNVPAAALRVVVFKPLNLIAPWPMRGPFDAVFCRNVTIYFDRQTQSAIFERIGTILVPGGFLYIGHSENLATAGGSFKLAGKTIYQSARTSQARSAA